MTDTHWTKAEALGLTTQKLDIRLDYKDEVNLAMQKAIAKAWSDPSYKRQLIANAAKELAALGIYFPDQYTIEFYDDPSAKVGDWTTTGKGQKAVLRIPIPAAPSGGKLSADDLRTLSAADNNCCCCTGLCTCTGAASQETWY